jgi:hypothetical protein
VYIQRLIGVEGGCFRRGGGGDRGGGICMDSSKEYHDPPAVKAIHGSAFYACSNLESVVFSQIIEEFVSCEAMQGIGVFMKRPYCFLDDAAYQSVFWILP